MKLYYMPGASALAVHIVLAWIGAPYEAVRMNRRSIKTPEYLRDNPAGTVPLLVDGDFLLTENVAILAYLAELHPHARLLGGGALRERAEVMRWLGFLNSDVHKGFKPIFSPERYLSDPAFAPELVATARAHLRDHLRRLDAQLEGRQWLTGSRSIADAYLFVMLRWAIGTKVGLYQLGNLSRFVRQMHADPGVHAALVAEEGLAPVQARAAVVADRDPYSHLDADVAHGATVRLDAEIVGAVEYREGEGMAFEMRRGIVAIDVNRVGTVFSWVDENYRGEAAMPFDNFRQYLAMGAIQLVE